MPLKIVMDTNFLLLPGQFGIDIFSEIDRICRFRYETCAMERTVEELALLMQNQKGKERSAAKLGLDLVKSGKVRILPAKNATFKNADKIISDFAASEQCIVATQDRELRRSLPEGTKTIVMRQRRYLQLIE